MASRSSGTSGIALATMAAGSAFLYAGIKGYSLTQAFQSIVQGKSPTTLSQAYPITTPQGDTSAAIQGPSPSGSNPAIAQEGLKYVGHCYSFGGAPGRDGSGCWDCSSFANWIIGVKLGRAIPGYGPGKYTGTTHGPPTTVWLVWSGAVTVSHKGADAIAGDLCVWQTHMGIAIGGGKMVSARSASSHPPTGIDTIEGDIPGELLFVRRLRGSATAGEGEGGPL